jgi:predicted RNA polymerase sigma factor
MECNIVDIKEAHELLGLMNHHAIRAGYLATFGDIEAAEKEMQRAIDLLNTTQS